MRIAIFGGSFDPPHAGHMMACYYILEVAGVDEVWMVPVYLHPFGKMMAPYENRLEMCRIAAEPFGGRVKVVGIEKELSKDGSPVFTVDLLEELKKRYVGHELVFVAGSDTLGDAPAWKEFNRIKELATLLILRRRGHDTECALQPAMLPEISSSFVRETVKNGGDAGALIPSRVLEYIKKENLYI